MRRGLIAVAAVAALAAAACGSEEAPDGPEEGSSESEVPQATDQWESAGELDNMPPEATAELEPPVAPEAIAGAFGDAGLGDGEAADLGTDAESCDLTDCVRAFESGETTVMIYMSEEMAADASEALEDNFVSGPVMLHYAASETPEDARGDYEAALADALE
ncbi:hypothetical protein [Glycomyces xiaoerkulensis]|uniref:hypothetical protein n=1 Tax=Glycomyces xiaoerkulensis TaxID=2038139 RepID=UPI00130010B1|nr:hypothetical protein [Glycomyces xiaoerkulensis]